MQRSDVEWILRRHKRDIIAAMTFAIKDLRGGYSLQPVEDVYALCEASFQAHADDLFHRNVRPLVRLSETLGQRRAMEGLRLHEVIRAAHVFKKVVMPILIENAWEDRSTLVEALLRVDRTVDRFVINLTQAYLYYARHLLPGLPMEFPVCVDPAEHAREEGVAAL